MQVYLDNAATTKLDPMVLKAMMPYLADNYGNAMSVHQYGQNALSGTDKAREQVANFLNCKSTEVLFTSGATESNNLALKGVVDAYKEALKPHLIVSAIEHDCVLETAKYLKNKDLIELDFVKPDNQGIISPLAVKKIIKPNTILISIMYVNNEIGVIQPIAEIAKQIKKINKNIYFHTDAVQAMNYLSCNVDDLGVDLLSFSGHKIYGPKGIGVLYRRSGVKINKIQHGGEQENRLRAGTHNVSGIVGLGEAVALIDFKHNANIKKLRDYLFLGIKKNISNIEINGSFTERTPNNLNVSFKNIEGEGILISLDLEGIAVSTGSACSSGSLDPSHVIMEISNSDHLRSHASVRFTLSKFTTKKEIDYVLKKLPLVVARLRKISPFK
ncbi:MAG: cysteine desulfurase family protein [Patescibacteria group bacterium]